MMSSCLQLGEVVLIGEAAHVIDNPCQPCRAGLGLACSFFGNVGSPESTLKDTIMPKRLDEYMI